jgi:5-methylcytosine-specific restriction endonuclease McrA
MKGRAPVRKELQIAIFRRDGWLCCWCKRPVIFAPVMKYLERELDQSGVHPRVAYHHAHWTRDGAPLLDELGAVIDHIEAQSKGGSDDKENLATACNKCNALKSASAHEKFSSKLKIKPVKGKYGEPKNWDGLSNIFVMLANRNLTILTESERKWLRALTAAELSG